MVVICMMITGCQQDCSPPEGAVSKPTESGRYWSKKEVAQIANAAMKRYVQKETRSNCAVATESKSLSILIKRHATQKRNKTLRFMLLTFRMKVLC